MIILKRSLTKEDFVDGKQIPVKVGRLFGKKRHALATMQDTRDFLWRGDGYRIDEIKDPHKPWGISRRMKGKLVCEGFVKRVYLDQTVVPPTHMHVEQSS